MIHQLKLWVIAFLMVCGFCMICPRYVHAHPNWPSNSWGVPFSIDAGWDDMLINGGGYEKNNHGFNVNLAVGLYFVELGVLLEQELGFIDLRPIDSDRKNSILFKGATLGSLFLRLPLTTIDHGYHISSQRHYHIYGELEIIPKLGIGAMYMETPTWVKMNVQSWFAFRPAVGLFWGGPLNRKKDIYYSAGVEFDYTLAASSPNVFDNKRIMNFVSAKAKIVFWFEG